MIVWHNAVRTVITCTAAPECSMRHRVSIYLGARATLCDWIIDIFAAYWFPPSVRQPSAIPAVVVHKVNGIIVHA